MIYLHPPRFDGLRSKSKRVFHYSVLGVRAETVWLLGFLLSFALAPFRLAREFYFGLLGTPRAMYYAARDTRDWILAKVAYLQDESDKWRRCLLYTSDAADE